MCRINYEKTDRMVGLSPISITSVADGDNAKPIIVDLTCKEERRNIPPEYFAENGYVYASSTIENFGKAKEIISDLASEGSSVALIGRGRDAEQILAISTDPSTHVSSVILIDGGIEKNTDLFARAVDSGIAILLYTGRFSKNAEACMHTYIGLQNTFFGQSTFAPMSKGQAVSPKYQLILDADDPTEVIDLNACLRWFDNWTKFSADDLRKSTEPLHLWHNDGQGWFHVSSYPIVQYEMHMELTPEMSLSMMPLESTSECAIGKDAVVFCSDQLTYNAGMGGPSSATIYVKNAQDVDNIQVELFDQDIYGNTTVIGRGTVDSDRLLDEEMTLFEHGGNVLWPSYKETGTSSDAISRFDIFLGFLHQDVLAEHSIVLKVKVNGGDSCKLLMGKDYPSCFNYPLVTAACFDCEVPAPSKSIWSVKNQTFLGESNEYRSVIWQNDHFYGDFGSYTKIKMDAVRDDGKLIAGDLFLPKKEGKQALVVMLHGICSTKGWYRPYQHYLAEKGIASYSFDCVGSSVVSHSDGSTYDLSLSSIHKDLDTVFDMLRDLDAVDATQMFLMGHSQGGFATVMYAPKHVDELKGIIPVAPAVFLADIAKTMFPGNTEIPEKTFLIMPLSGNYFAELRDCIPEEIIPGYTKDVLLLQGSMDGSVPVENTREIAKLYQSVDYRELPTGHHDFAGENLDCAKTLVYDFLKNHID